MKKLQSSQHRSSSFRARRFLKQWNQVNLLKMSYSQKYLKKHMITSIITITITKSAITSIITITIMKSVIMSIITTIMKSVITSIITTIMKSMSTIITMESAVVDADITIMIMKVIIMQMKFSQAGVKRQFILIQRMRSVQF